MSARRPLLLRILRCLRWLAVAASSVALLVLAYGGLQDCRGGRLIIAKQTGSNLEATVELVSREHRLVVWDQPLPREPLRVFFPLEHFDSQFIVTATDSHTGEVSAYEYGYMVGKGESYYLLVGETDVYFASTLGGYFGDPYLPVWANLTLSLLYAASDELTCAV